VSLRIDETAFARGHEAFLAYMHARSGRGARFTSFQHDFLCRDEIDYKYKVFCDATAVLQPDRWRSWRKTPGKILKAVREACRPKVSRNLLQHRWGGSYKALYKVRKANEIQALEGELYAFFNGSPVGAEFALRFDAFASFLRDHSLGCAWPFPTYLAFLQSHQSYFPVRPRRMQALLRFYGIDQKVSGRVIWERYALLLELADVLRDKLEAYRPAGAIDIQSYMWEVGSLLEDDRIPTKLAQRQVDFDEELRRRIKAAEERERVGLAGERYVLDEEKAKLLRAGRSDLAARVELVSATGNDSGFDVRSFEANGNELHIEVKTTASLLDSDRGFFLTDGERQCAKTDSQTDSHWTIHRVSNINAGPEIAVLGNLVTGDHPEWDIRPSAWLVTRKGP